MEKLRPRDVNQPSKLTHKRRIQTRSAYPGPHRFTVYQAIVAGHQKKALEGVATKG